MKKIISFIVVLVFGLSIGGVSVYGISNLRGKKEDVFSEETHVEVENIKEILKPANELVSTEYRYTDVDVYKKNKKFLGKKVPFTTDKTVFVYSGIIKIGIDLSAVQISVDDEKKIISISLQKPYIISHELDEKSFKTYDIKDSIFTSTSLDGYADLIADLKEQKEEKINADREIFDSVVENTKTVFTELLGLPELTNEYKVVFE